MTVIRPAAALLALAFVALSPAHAQAVKKAPAKTLDGAAKRGGPLLTRDELRACIKNQETQKAERAEIERERAELTQEKAQIQAAQSSVKDHNARVAAYNTQVAERERRVAAYAERVKEHNAAANKGDADKATVDRERAVLDIERAEMVRMDETLKAEAQALKSPSTAGPAVPAERIETWNRRNAALVKRGEAWELENDAWKDECAGRRYDELDEIAIRKGK